MRLRVLFVCAFSAVPQMGNPAAVVLLDAPMAEDRMQAIAAELAQPITAFVAGQESTYWIRWYTPRVEDLVCGHGTIAAAHALVTAGVSEAARITFQYRAGTLHIRRIDSGYGLTLPAPALALYRDGGEVARALGCSPVELFTASDKIIALLASEAEIRAIAPDLRAVAALPRPGLVVTARGEATDFVSRYFAPAKGIPEDHVTGASHAILAPFWSARLGRDQLSAAQLSARGCVLACRVVDRTAVEVVGQACSFLDGYLHI